jgi:hypothetical protein
MIYVSISRFVNSGLLVVQLVGIHISFLDKEREKKNTIIFMNNHVQLIMSKENIIIFMKKKYFYE